MQFVFFSHLFVTRLSVVSPVIALPPPFPVHTMAHPKVAFKVPPSTCNQLQEVAAAYFSSLPQYGPEKLELEVRFGTVRQGRFIPGMRPDDYHLVADKLQQYLNWDKKRDSFESYSYYYEDNGQTLRTTCRPSPNGSGSLQGSGRGKRAGTGPLETRNGLQVSTVRKEKIMEKTFCQPHPDLAGEGLDFRLSLSAEVPIPVSCLPPLVTPSLVRIKQRNSYVRSPWSYDLTLAWQGSTRAAAEQAQRVAGTTRYEVEIEYCPPTPSDPPKYTDAADLALALYYKVQSIVRLVSNQTTDYLPAEHPTYPRPVTTHY